MPRSPFRYANAVLLSGALCGLVATLIGVGYLFGVIAGDLRVAVTALAVAATVCTVTGIAMSVPIHRRLRGRRR